MNHYSDCKNVSKVNSMKWHHNIPTQNSSIYMKSKVARNTVECFLSNIRALPYQKHTQMFATYSSISKRKNS